MIGILWIDDRDVATDFGFVVSDVDGLDGWPGIVASAPNDVPLLEGPTMSGGVIDQPRLRIRPAHASITGRIEAASTTAARALLDALKATIGGRQVRVRAIYAPDRYCKAVLETQGGGAYQKELVNGLLSVTLNFSVPDGVAYRLEPDGYALNTGRTSCPIGTVDVKPVISLHGNGSTLVDPLITVRDAAGNPTQTFGFSTGTLTGGVLAADQVIRADSKRGAIDLITAGVVDDGWSLQSSGDFIVLRTQDALFEGGAAQTVELSAAAGAVLGGIDYTRAFR